MHTDSHMPMSQTFLEELPVGTMLERIHRPAEGGVSSPSLWVKIDGPREGKRWRSNSSRSLDDHESSRFLGTDLEAFDAHEAVHLFRVVGVSS